MKYKYLTKMQKHCSLTTLTFNLPAGITCPGAGACKQWCYSIHGVAAVMPSVRLKYNNNLAATRNPDTFADEIKSDIQEFLRSNPDAELRIRLHSSGDFYSISYYLMWLKIIGEFRSERRLKFYAYTKSLEVIRQAEYTYPELSRVPRNLHLIFSHGGKDDHLISEDNCQARIFDTDAEMEAAGFVSVMEDDTLAMSTKRVGLLSHGRNKKLINN